MPTVCIEHVYVWNNTSVIADEILAHRLGLVPLNTDPALVYMKNGTASLYRFLSSLPLHIHIQFIYASSSTANDPPTDRNTLVFRLQLACTRNPKAPKEKDINPDKPPSDSELYIGHELLSSHLKWEPQGEQDTVFASNPPAPTNPNIVLAKLRPGQEVDMELHAVKGVGKDHAKFSPVGALLQFLFFPCLVLICLIIN